jgi:hypothetical protein
MISLQSRKMKVDKKFQPISKDNGDEFYPNGIFEFNITKLLVFIKANPYRFQPEEVSIKAIRLPFQHLNESTIQSANTMEPIVLAEISPDSFNVIDGHHRLEKVYREGASHICAYQVKAEQHIQFLTSVKAYHEYVVYWNSKIQQYSRQLKHT